MEQNRNTTRPSAKMLLGDILLRAAMILLCMVLLSVHLMGSLFAKYSTTATGSDSARVAKFDVDVIFSDGNSTISGITADLEYGENGEYTITVVNNSEVAISYVIRIENIALETTDKNGNIVATAITKGVSAKLATDGQEDKTFRLWEGATSVNFGSLGTLSPGSSQQTHTLTFPIVWESYTESITGDYASVKITFKVVVDVMQVD